MSNTTHNYGQPAGRAEELSEQELREIRRREALARIIGHQLPPIEEYDGMYCLDPDEARKC
jgi:hypothetical protein